MNKKTAIYISIFVIIGTSFFVGRSFLPAVEVNGQILNYADFFKNRDGLINFRDLRGESVSDEEIEKSVIESFIEDSLIKSELERRGKTNADTENFISENLDPRNLENLGEATGRLYGWSEDDFKKFVLYPQAQRIILNEEFNKEGVDVDKWLLDSLQKADIQIHVRGWNWESGEVKRR